jgi:hypothetical protein
MQCLQQWFQHSVSFSVSKQSSPFTLTTKFNCYQGNIQYGWSDLMLLPTLHPVSLNLLVWSPFRCSVLHDIVGAVLYVCVSQRCWSFMSHILRSIFSCTWTSQLYICYAKDFELALHRLIDWMLNIDTLSLN